MGLKESGLRGSLRSVSTGVSAIPDTGVLLDDFADTPTVTSSEVTDRKDFGELAYQFDRPSEQETDFNNAPSRPDYNVDSGAPTVDNGLLQLDFEDHLLANQFEMDLNGDRTWEFEFDNISGSSWTVVISIFAETNNYTTDSDPSVSTTGLENGYMFFARDDLDCRIFRVDGDDDTTQLIRDDLPSTSDVTVTITRASNGEFELFADGNSLGTATDTTHTVANHTGIACGRDEGSFDLKRYEVF